MWYPHIRTCACTTCTPQPKNHFGQCPHKGTSETTTTASPSSPRWCIQCTIAPYQRQLRWRTQSRYTRLVPTTPTTTSPPPSVCPIGTPTTTHHCPCPVPIPHPHLHPIHSFESQRSCDPKSRDL